MRLQYITAIEGVWRGAGLVSRGKSMVSTGILIEYVRAFLVGMVCSTFLLSMVCTIILTKYGKKGYFY